MNTLLLKSKPPIVGLLFIIVIGALTYIVQTHSTVSQPASIPSVKNIVANYKGMTLVTPESLGWVDWGLCRMPIPGLDTPVHAPPFEFLNIYVNETGLAAMAESGEREFPVGSVIVKEKLGTQVSYSLAESSIPVTGPVTGLGIMVKHEAGFNPDGGDWEYAYWEAGNLYQEAQHVAHCQACHEAGVVPPEWEETYHEFGILFASTARDSVFLTLPLTEE